MDATLQAWLDHRREAARLLKLCTRDNWLAGHNYREHMKKEQAIMDAFSESQHYWHMKELREKELNESRQEQASDSRAEV